MSLRNGTLIVADNAMQTAMHSALTQDATLQPRSAKKGKSTLDEVEVSGVVSGGEKCFLCEVDETGKKIHVYEEKGRYEVSGSSRKKYAGFVIGKNVSLNVFLYEQTVDVPEYLVQGYLCLVIEPAFPFGRQTLTPDEISQKCTLAFCYDTSTVFYVQNCEKIVPLAEIKQENNPDGSTGKTITCTQIYDGGDIELINYTDTNERYYKGNMLYPEFRFISDPTDVQFLKLDQKIGIEKLDATVGFHIIVYRFTSYSSTSTAATRDRKFIALPYQIELKERRLWDATSDLSNFDYPRFHIAKFAEIETGSILANGQWLNTVSEDTSSWNTTLDKDVSQGVIPTQIGMINFDTEIITNGEKYPGAPYVIEQAKSITIYEKTFRTFSPGDTTCEELEIPVSGENADGVLHHVYATLKYDSEQKKYIAEYKDLAIEGDNKEDPPDSSVYYCFIVATYSIAFDDEFNDKPNLIIYFHDKNIDKFNVEGLWLC